MINPLHAEILSLIKVNSGKGTKHTLLDSYLGNSNPRYAITAPVLRKLAKDWMRANKDLSADEFSALLNSLIQGDSSTEKMFAGMLMDCATVHQGSFNPDLFDQWLDYLQGWAEVDSVCTGQYTIRQLPLHWKKWKPLIMKFANDQNPNKRRASLVLLCSPISRIADKEMAAAAFANIDRLRSEKELLITKAISWLLRSMVKHHKKLVADYIRLNQEYLPKIALRETMVKLKTGKKTGKKV